MAPPKPLCTVLQCAMDTLMVQPREVPQAPAGWLEKAQLALESDDEPAMLECALDIARAHAQYPAEFDDKGWLYDLRQALYPPKSQ